MTTTLIQTGKSFVKINSFAGIKSLHSIVITILFILIVSTVELHAQSGSISKLPPVLKVGSYRKSIQVSVPINYSKYTVLLAKNFPTIKGVTQNLSAKEENEFADHDFLCLIVPEKKSTGILNAANKLDKQL